MGLIGRDLERKQLAELIGGAGDHGGALLVRGEAGVGKSTLLAEAIETAAESGLRVLSATGCDAEQQLPFAGLHQLVYPFQSGIDALPAPQRAALATALGLADAPASSGFLVGLATLTLLAEAATDRPLLLVVDDAHWLDRPSAEALVFVARRLESEPIVVIAALRDDAGSPLARAGLPAMVLERLSESAAGELLDAVAPDLPAAARSRLLREAAGNPLALTELPAGFRDLDEHAPAIALSERLARAFTARLAELPTPTRTVLLVAALNDSDAAAETLAAATVVLGYAVDSAALAPAVAAGLVEP